MDYIAHYISPIGDLTMAACGEKLVGLWFDDQKWFGEGLDTNHEENALLPVLMETKEWLDIFFSGKAPQFTPPLLLRGTPFRQKIWSQLMTIPYSHTTTYGDIAHALGVSSARAIGGAVGHNHISLIIPCHRVIGAGKTLTGYAGGIERKRQLLNIEHENYD
ncbi:MAG: methylated-DNA--[protein]-cysteine S-methyltransferase [Bacteroidaceae bacterium]|nr:methylated-DNA--[protein]-cysteine S-methyltransferase [Bacteroidaceae bacterium]